MAEELLDCSEISAAVEQVCRCAVAERVWPCRSGWGVFATPATAWRTGSSRSADGSPLGRQQGTGPHRLQTTGSANRTSLTA